MHTRRVVVIGAGVIGASIALEASRSGWQVTVVDQLAGPGLGSTSASSAIVRYHYNHLPEAALAWEAGHRWQDWQRFLGCRDPRGHARFVRSGALVLDGALLDRDPNITNLRTLGVPFEELSAEEIRNRFPAVDVSRFGPPARTEDEGFWREPEGELSGYWVPDAGHVDDPQLAALNLAHAAGEHGCDFVFKRRVVGIRTARHRISGVVLDDGTAIEGDVVVNAAGPWSRSVNELAGVLDDFNVTTQPLEQEVISLPIPDGFVDGNGTCVTDPDIGTYFRPHGDTLIVGGMEAICDPLEFLQDPDEARTAVSAPTWEVQSLRVARRMPSLTVPTRRSGIVGVYDVTEDWIPVYDRTSLPGFYVAIGTSGHGFKQAPVVGEILVTLIEECESGRDHDAAPLVLFGRYTGAEIDIGHFSRRRVPTPQAGMG